MFASEVALAAPVPARARILFKGSTVSKSTAAPTPRSYFPETWLWDSGLTGYYHVVHLHMLPLDEHVITRSRIHALTAGKTWCSVMFSLPLGFKQPVIRSTFVGFKQKPTTDRYSLIKVPNIHCTTSDGNTNIL